jgi:nucleotide-binding universal stress UspA family protein
MYVAQVAARLREQGLEHVETSVWYGPAAPAIVEVAEDQHVDLIVMSGHGRSGVRRLIFGSVAETVLRGTRTPILIVREPGAPVARPMGAIEVHTTTGIRRAGGTKYQC